MTRRSSAEKTLFALRPSYPVRRFGFNLIEFARGDCYHFHPCRDFVSRVRSGSREGSPNHVQR